MRQQHLKSVVRLHDFNKYYTNQSSLGCSTHPKWGTKKNGTGKQNQPQIQKLRGLNSVMTDNPDKACLVSKIRVNFQFCPYDPLSNPCLPSSLWWHPYFFLLRPRPLVSVSGSGAWRLRCLLWYMCPGRCLLRRSLAHCSVFSKHVNCWDSGSWYSSAFPNTSFRSLRNSWTVW